MRRLQAARDGFSDDLLHTGVIVSTSYTYEWHVTSVLGLQREETKINYGFHQKKKQVVRLQMVVFAEKRSYTVAVMPRL